MEARAAAPLFTQLNEDWIKIGEKPTGGKNNGGSLCGIYQNRQTGEIFLIKQDDDVSKNIAEFIASRIMRLVNPDDPDAFAEIKLFFIPGETKPDKNGRNVYIGSRFHGNFTELWKDAYNAYNFIETYQDHRPNYFVNRPASRPQWITKDKIVTMIVESGRYKGLAKGLVASSFVDDPDVNPANFGAVPLPCPYQCQHACAHSGYKRLKYRGKEEKVFHNVKVVRCDFGAALGDKRRKLDNHLHLNEIWRYIKPVSFRLFFGDGPPNYTCIYPKEIIYERSFVLELLKLSCCPTSVLNRGIMQVMQEIRIYFGQQPLFEFAQHVGADAFMKKKGFPLHPSMGADDLIRYTTLFLQQKFRKRLRSARKNAEEIANELKIKGEEFLRLVEFADKEIKKFYLYNAENIETNKVAEEELEETTKDRGHERMVYANFSENNHHHITTINLEQSATDTEESEKEEKKGKGFERLTYAYSTENNSLQSPIKKDNFFKMSAILNDIRSCLVNFFKLEHSLLTHGNPLLTTFLCDFDPEKETGYKLALAYDLICRRETIPTLTVCLLETFGSEMALEMLGKKIKNIICKFYTEEKNFEIFIEKNVENAIETLYRPEHTQPGFKLS